MDGGGKLSVADFPNCPLTTASAEVKPHKVKITDDGITMLFLKALRKKQKRKKMRRLDIKRIQKIIKPFGVFLYWDEKGDPDELFIERHPSEFEDALQDFKRGLDAIWDTEW